jgi:hypothetical protein
MNMNMDNEQVIIFDVELQIRRKSDGEIDWEPIKQYIEHDYREYVTEGELNGW